jgi:hypothetical protein
VYVSKFTKLAKIAEIAKIAKITELNKLTIKIIITTIIIIIIIILIKSLLSIHSNNGKSHGLVVKADGSWSRGRGFKPRHRILDASYYIKPHMKITKIKVAEWGTPKKYLKKVFIQTILTKLAKTYKSNLANLASTAHIAIAYN